MELLYRESKLQGIKVGSVEEFQGQVRLLVFAFILISHLNGSGTSCYHNINCSQQRKPRRCRYSTLTRFRS